MASYFDAGIWYHPVIDRMSRNNTFTHLVFEVSLLDIVLPINSEFRQVQGNLKQSTFHEKKFLPDLVYLRISIRLFPIWIKLIRICQIILKQISLSVLSVWYIICKY